MSRCKQYGVVWSVSRASLVALVLVLLPLFVALAVAPMLLLLLPLVIIVGPFVVFACLAGAADNRTQTRHIHAWKLLDIPTPVPGAVVSRHD